MYSNLPAGGAPTPPPSARRQLGLWGDLGDLWHDATDAGEDVVGAVTHPISTLKKVANFVGSVVNGDLDIGDKTESIAAYSWPKSSSTMSDGEIDFSGSGVDFDIGITMGLDVEDWNLQSAELMLTGSARAGINSKITADATLLSLAKSFTLVSSDSLGSDTFTIGPVPFHAGASLSLDLRVQASIAASATVSTAFSASGELELGVKYADGGWQSIASKSWGYTHQAPSLNVDVKSTATVSLVPTLKLDFDWIGGPRGSLIPYITALAQVSSSGTCSAMTGYGLNVGVGAEINLEDPLTGKSLGTCCKKSWATKLIYQSGLQPQYKCSTCSECGLTPPAAKASASSGSSSSPSSPSSGSPSPPSYDAPSDLTGSYDFTAIMDPPAPPQPLSYGDSTDGYEIYSYGDAN